MPCLLYTYLALSACRVLQTTFLYELTYNNTQEKALCFYPPQGSASTETAAWYLVSPVLDYQSIKFNLEKDMPLLPFHMISIHSHSLNFLNQHEDNWKLTMVIFQWVAYANWIIFQAKKTFSRQGVRKNWLDSIPELYSYSYPMTFSWVKTGRIFKIVFFIIIKHNTNVLNMLTIVIKRMLCSNVLMQ